MKNGDDRRRAKHRLEEDECRDSRSCRSSPSSSLVGRTTRVSMSPPPQPQQPHSPAVSSTMNSKEDVDVTGANNNININRNGHIVNTDNDVIMSPKRRRTTRRHSVVNEEEQQQQHQQRHRQVLNDDDGDDDDDDVEILFVKPAVDADVPHTGIATADAAVAVTASATQMTTASSSSSTATSILPQPKDEGDGPPDNTTFKAFPARSSAYLQTLAEICHTILWDARWRVVVTQVLRNTRPVAKSELPSSTSTSTSSSSMPIKRRRHQQRLFSWELGDDLGVVMELSQRYIISPHDVEKNIDANDKGNANGKENNEDEELDRRLELYSRLYFRKGPWFRLDDIFNRYYLPNARMRYQHHKSENTVEDDNIDQNYTGNVERNGDVNHDDRNNKNKKRRASADFFVPQSRVSTATRRSSNSPRDYSGKKDQGVQLDSQYFDDQFLRYLLESVVSMVDDVKRLAASGFIRTFQSEEECGETVGRSDKYMHSILTQEEQNTVLGNLGGAKTRKRPSFSASDRSSNGGVGGSRAGSLVENSILKQMSQQRAIVDILLSSSNAPQSKSSRTVLPVRKHVDSLIFEKLVRIVSRACRKVEYIPSAQYRLAAAVINDRLARICDGLFGIDVNSGTTPPMCLRLRESPLMALRRICRLYICATSGPGNMRGDGTNAWQSLPESHSKSFASIPLRTQYNSPPGSNSWHQISYPGKDWRLRTVPFYFLRSHVPLLVDTSCGLHHREDDARHAGVAVFSSVESFHRWETAVDLRANVDYLIELNDLVLYENRKEARRQEMENKDRSFQDHASHGLNDNEIDRFESTFTTSRSPAESEDDSSSSGEEKNNVDFLGLLTIQGRIEIIQKFIEDPNRSRHVCRGVELDISSVLAIPIEDRPLDTLQTIISHDAAISKGNFVNIYETILGVIGVITCHVLDDRVKMAMQHERKYLRPFLRHMCWEGVLSYLLWDIIPVLEKRGYYDLAVKGLEILLFGRPLERKNGNVLPECLVTDTDKFGSSSFSQLFLSRRARGKAFDRLMVDYTHLLRHNRASNKSASVEKDGTIKTKQKQNKRKSDESSPDLPKLNDVIAKLTEPLLHTHLQSGQITFSTARNLARRLKRPLVHILNGLFIFESSELGHRFQNSSSSIEEKTAVKYSDWRPKTDIAIANSMSTSAGRMGGRCTYVGFEDEGENNSTSFGSLNVEELAKEYYFSGRLPVASEASDSSCCKGGWVGWHDEGGKIRTLFRILAAEILGMDWTRGDDNKPSVDDTLVFLTPYQGSPFDLHVGAQRTTSKPDSESSEWTMNSEGFYVRRKASIEAFLSKISKLDGEDLSRLVYDCISDRLAYAKKINHVDDALSRDVQNVRTYSFLAAGFGGRHLADAMRCMFFDYRHYSGGFPDLLLCRAQYKPEAEVASPPDQLEFVDLGKWIGESFSVEYQSSLRSERANQMLEDRDDDFLGCSKAGDSGGRGNKWYSKRPPGRWSGLATNNEQQEKENLKEVEMPARLELHYKGRHIVPECMFVEVKSQNDRLDARQEDWLNILDVNGKARVCKFVKPPKPPSQKKKTTMTSKTRAGS